MSKMMMLIEMLLMMMIKIMMLMMMNMQEFLLVESRQPIILAQMLKMTMIIKLNLKCDTVRDKSFAQNMFKDI